MNVHAKEDPEKLFFSVSLFSFVNRQKSFGASTVFYVLKQTKTFGWTGTKRKTRGDCFKVYLQCDSFSFKSMAIKKTQLLLNVNQEYYHMSRLLLKRRNGGHRKIYFSAKWL